MASLPCARLYNAALQERRDAWQKAGVSVMSAYQMAQLPEIKHLRPEYKEIGFTGPPGCHSAPGPCLPVFFQACKDRGKARLPRFKSRQRYRSLTFKQTGWELNGRRLTLQGIGTAKLFLSRSIEGTIKTVTLKRDLCGDWWVTFSCDHVEPKPLPETGRAVGVDVGLEKFLATSDGEFVDNPRLFRRAETELKRTQRWVSKRKRGGRRRRKMIRTLARRHRKVKRSRRDHHFKAALQLVRQYDLIAVEDLNVRGLARSMLAMSVQDAGWSQFISILCGKAESAGRVVIAVNPSGTSRVCSGCGCEPRTKKSLSVRIHRCSECNLVLSRDVNAARNILHLAAPNKRGRAGS